MAHALLAKYTCCLNSVVQFPKAGMAIANALEPHSRIASSEVTFDRHRSRNARAHIVR